MAAAVQQDIIAIFWVNKFKLNKHWAHCMAQPSIKESGMIVSGPDYGCRRP